MSRVNLDPIAGARGAFAITPSDATEFEKRVHGIWVGTGGDVVVVHLDGTQATYTVPDGTLLPVRARKVMAATTADALVGMYF